jgi:hypothetical protein
MPVVPVGAIVIVLVAGFICRASWFSSFFSRRVFRNLLWRELGHPPNPLRGTVLRRMTVENEPLSLRIT